MTDLKITINLDGFQSGAYATINDQIEAAIYDEVLRQLDSEYAVKVVQDYARIKLQSLIMTVVERRLWDKHWSVIEKVVDRVLTEMEVTTK